MAPELQRIQGTVDDTARKDRTPYGTAVDVWAIGVLAYECMVGVAPFRRKDADSTAQAVLFSRVKVPPSLSEDAKEFIEACLAPRCGFVGPFLAPHARRVGR